MRRLAVAALAVLVLVSGCAASFDTNAPTDADSRPDPASDTLGWERGYWHNDSLAVDASDGLSEAELDAVVARAMARVEVIRGREFEQSVGIEVRSREQFRADSGTRDAPTEERLRRNTLYEALFFVGEGTDALSVLAANRAGGTLGYYSPAEDRIVVIGDGSVDERTLGHELVHALQDQQFETDFERGTVEGRNVAASVIEGDASYVDYRYGERCGAEWECLTTEGGGGAGYAHVGIALFQVFPYSDGPAFVADRYRAGGWAAVDALYRAPPASTEQVIHPGAFGRDPPTAVDVEDSSGPAWSVIGRETVGEPGLFTMLWYPSYQNGSDVVVPRNVSGGPPPDVYDYDHPYTAGWDGDQLVAYARENSAATNETGYVWKTVWDSPEDAREFARGYRELLEYYGARRGGDATYVVEDAAFADAFHLTVEGDTVTVVNAPTVEDLSGVRAGVTVEGTPRPTTTTPDAAGPTAATETTRVPGTPGFTAGAAALALLCALLWWRR